MSAPDEVPTVDIIDPGAHGPFRALTSATRALANITDETEAMRVVASAAVRLSGGQRAAIVLRRDDAPLRVITADARGRSAEADPLPHALDERIYPHLRDALGGSLVAVPLAWDDHIQGVLAVSGAAGDALLLGALGDQAAVALRGLRASGAQVTELRQELEDLKAEDQRRAQSLAATAHDLKTPLATIRFACEILGRGFGEESPNEQRIVRSVRAAARNLETLIVNLLEVGRLATGTLSVYCSPTSIRSPVQEAIEIAQPLATRQKVTLDVHVPDAEAWCDSGALRQVMVNLLTNAIKFSPTGEHVYVGALGDLDTVTLLVVDHGPGIAEEEQQRIFQPYYRTAAADGTERDGTGLGLAVVRGLTEHMGGTVSVRSSPGGGATFFVTLRTTAPDDD